MIGGIFSLFFYCMLAIVGICLFTALPTFDFQNILAMLFVLTFYGSWVLIAARE